MRKLTAPALRNHSDGGVGGVMPEGVRRGLRVGDQQQRRTGRIHGRNIHEGGDLYASERIQIRSVQRRA